MNSICFICSSSYLLLPLKACKTAEKRPVNRSDYLQMHNKHYHLRKLLIFIYRTPSHNKIEFKKCFLDRFFISSAFMHSVGGFLILLNHYFKFCSIYWCHGFSRTSIQVWGNSLETGQVRWNSVKCRDINYIAKSGAVWQYKTDEQHGLWWSICEFNIFNFIFISTSTLWSMHIWPKIQSLNCVERPFQK